MFSLKTIDIRQLVLCCSLLFYATTVYSGAAVDASNLRVAVSIKPLKLIASEILGSHDDIAVIVGAAQSPHDYALKMSDIRSIQRADLMIWVGPHFESFLAKIIPKHAATALTVGDLIKLPNTANDRHNPAHESAGEIHSKHAGHHPFERDLHVWLNPYYVETIALAMRDKLITLNPDKAAIFANNTKRFIGTLRSVDNYIGTKLEPVKSKGFYVYHDAYSHFVERYGLNQVGAFKVLPNAALSLKQLSDIKNTLQDGEVYCIFEEPQFDNQFVRRFDVAADIRFGRLDPLATNIAYGPGAYQLFIKGFADTIYQCLGSSGGTE